MSKHHISPKALCPYYLHQERPVIYCKGVCRDSVIHLAFANGSRYREYQCEYCERSYERCHIFKMLDAENTETGR